MSEIDIYVDQVRRRIDLYSACSPEQALVYSCEDVSDAEYPSRLVKETDVLDFIEAICDSEGLDTPTVLIEPTRGNSLASTDVHTGIVCLHRRVSTVATILHELAHHHVGADHHGTIFRDELVRLIRRHIGVEHAAFLHQLMSRSGLEMSPWQSTAR